MKTRRRFGISFVVTLIMVSCFSVGGVGLKLQKVYAEEPMHSGLSCTTVTETVP